MHLSLLGVDKFFVLLYQLEALGKLLSPVLLTHVIRELLEVTSVEINHFFVACLICHIGKLNLRVAARGT
jgi:hypothetical protein